MEQRGEKMNVADTLRLKSGTTASTTPCASRPFLCSVGALSARGWTGELRRLPVTLTDVEEMPLHPNRAAVPSGGSL